MKPLVEVSHLKKYFKTSGGILHAVDDVSLTIKRGEVLGVVGESGCGKSTLGRTVLRLLDPSDGTIKFDGEDITNCSRQRLKELRKRMQMIFQDPFASLDPRKTVRETIEEPLKIYHLFPVRRERQDYVDKLMDTVGLSMWMANSYPHELDGGRRQRVGIARAMALEPDFIVCDEPVSSLDVSIQAQILNLMQDLQEERQLAYMFVTHDLSVVRHISTSILVMYLGQIVEYAPTDELFEYPLHPYTRALLSAVPVADVDVSRDRILLKGEISSPINPKDGCRFAPRCYCARDDCEKVSCTLREVSPGHFVSCRYQ